jgi:hypothetical protein
MTTVGEVVFSFFNARNHSDKLWIMDSNDDYTKIVRRWQPVIASINVVRSAAIYDCDRWKVRYKSAVNRQGFIFSFMGVEVKLNKGDSDRSL